MWYCSISHLHCISMCYHLSDSKSDLLLIFHQTYILCNSKKKLKNWFLKNSCFHSLNSTQFPFTQMSKPAHYDVGKQHTIPTLTLSIQKKIPFCKSLKTTYHLFLSKWYYFFLGSHLNYIIIKWSLFKWLNDMNLN